ncbi:uncharacterized protein [Gossypium hirsutum]|uniref:Uncharacterized protein n=1 Tax=Gossypium hirsutum TaxID=3635 RepID=A0ABM3B105_GOSHI|nr:uncharacterized protein LOC121223399 [Gossypium hirsutum]
MMDLESPSIITSVKPNSIPVSTTSKQARASISNVVPTTVCKRDLETRTSPFAFRTTIPEADLKPWQLNEASKLILIICSSGDFQFSFSPTKFLFLSNQIDHKLQPNKRHWDSLQLPNTQDIHQKHAMKSQFPPYIRGSCCFESIFWHIS